MSDHGLPANAYNPHAWISGDPVIGEDCWIGAFTVLDGSGGLTIGRGVDVSCGAQIYTHSTARRCVSERRDDVERRPTAIGDCVFIGANAIILMGVNVGAHALIAAGAVVTADVEPFAIMAGAPARQIGVVRLTDDGTIYDYGPPE